MLGVAGMLLPEVFTQIGIINVPKWYDAGKSEYFASSSTLFVIEFILFHYVEIRRWQDIKYPGSVNQDPIFKSYSLPPNEVGYPGGIFNPLNFAATEEAKEKELANGKTIYHTDLFRQMNLTENDVTITYLKSRVLMSCDSFVQGGWQCWHSWDFWFNTMWPERGHSTTCCSISLIHGTTQLFKHLGETNKWLRNERKFWFVVCVIISEMGFWVCFGLFIVNKCYCSMYRGTTKKSLTMYRLCTSICSTIILQIKLHLQKKKKENKSNFVLPSNNLRNLRN